MQKQKYARGKKDWGVESLGKAIPKAAVTVRINNDKPRFLRDEKFWRHSEVAYLRQWHGRTSNKEIARVLGRTEGSVEIRAYRLGLDSPHCWENVWTSLSLSLALAENRSVTAHHMRQGVYPATTLYRNNAPTLVVYKKRFTRFVANPLNWWVFCDMSRWADPDLCALRDKTAARWGDKWMTTGEAAQLVNVATPTVTRWITEGLLPSSRKYANWRVLRSEVTAVARAKFGGGFDKKRSCDSNGRTFRSCEAGAGQLSQRTPVLKMLYKS